MPVPLNIEGIEKRNMVLKSPKVGRLNFFSGWGGFLAWQGSLVGGVGLVVRSFCWALARDVCGPPPSAREIQLRVGRTR